MRFDFGLHTAPPVLGAGARHPGTVVPPPPPPPPPPDPAHWAEAVFAAGETGFAYDPATPEGLWQDAAGTIPVAGDGDPVGRMEDRSGNGHHALQPTAARRPLWRTDGVRGWLDFDGADDELRVPAAALDRGATGFLAVVELTGNGFYPMILGDVSLSSGLTAGFGNAGARVPRFGVAGHSPVVLSGGAPLAIGTRAAMGYFWDGTDRILWRDGVELGRDAQTGQWTAGTQPLLCYSGSNVLNSPMRFFGGICVDRMPEADEARGLSAAMGRPLAPAGPATVLGDSAVAAYLDQPSALSLTGSIRTARDLAVPGDSIARQKAAWQAAGVAPSPEGYVMIEVGLNDLDPAEAAPVTIARLQDLVDTVRGDAGAMPVVLARLTPARARLEVVYGAQGGAAQAKWVAVNAAIAGTGPNPVTGVDARVVSHAEALDDGTGRLAAPYDLGDGIHPNAAGRQVIADAWVAALQGIGVTP